MQISNTPQFKFVIGEGDDLMTYTITAPTELEAARRLVRLLEEAQKELLTHIVTLN